MLQIDMMHFLSIKNRNDANILFWILIVLIAINCNIICLYQLILLSFAY